MSSESIFWTCGAAFGAWLMIHCPRSALREYRSGIAKGLNPTSHIRQDFVRRRNPVGFWLTIVFTFLAGLMGLGFFLFGIAFIILVEA
jgi:hypothetical protein